VVVFDATTMLLIMFPNRVSPPIDKKTSLPVTFIPQRINGLINRMKKDKTKIVIPSPAFGEILVRAGDDTQSFIDIINKDSVFRVEPFCAMAAVEVALIARQDRKGDRSSGVDENTLTYAKLKYDRQIVAIAKVHRAKALYTDDGHIIELCQKLNIEAMGVGDLEIPKDERQEKLFLTDKNLDNISHEEGIQEEATD